MTTQAAIVLIVALIVVLMVWRSRRSGVPSPYARSSARNTIVRCVR